MYSHLNKFDEAKKWVEKAIERVDQEEERQELYNVLKQLEAKRIPASFIHTK